MQRLQKCLGATRIQLFKSPACAWEFALHAYGIANGEVISTPLASGGLLRGLKKSGLQIRLADIDRHSLMPAAEAILNSISPQTRAIILPQGFGLPDDLQKLKPLASALGLALLIDAGSGFMGLHSGESQLAQGDAVICSLAGNAWLPGMAGALLLRNASDQSSIASLAPGKSAAMTWIQAARCVAALSHWKDARQARMKAMAFYRSCLPSWAIVWQPEFKPGEDGPDFGFYPVMLNSKGRRDRLIQRLAENDITANSLLLPEEYFPELMEQCPIARELAGKMCLLPLGRQVPGETVQEIADIVADISHPQKFFPKKAYAVSPKVSVLTITYNQEAYIEDCLKSVAMQQCDFPIEHIVGDDASSDRTREIILDYAAKYPHIRPLFQDERTYLTGNARAVASAAAGRYVALCEGDDFFTDPLKLQKQADALDGNPGSSICAHPVKVIQEGVGEVGLYPPRHGPTAFLQKRHIFSLDELLRHNIIQTNSAMYRWRFGDGIPAWYNFQLVPQDWYGHIIHAEIGSVFFIWEPMSVYRRHPGGMWQASRSRPKEHFEKFGYQQLRLLQVMMKHLNGRHASILLENSVIYFSQLYEFFGDDAQKIAFFREAFPSFALFYDREKKKKPWRRKAGWFVRSALRKIRNMAAAGNL